MILPRLHPKFTAVTAGFLLSAAAAAIPVPEGDEFQVNTFTTGYQDFQSVAGTPDGGFIVVWESAAGDGIADGVFLRRFDSSGTAVGEELQVNSYTTGDQQDPAVAVCGDGSFVVVWDGAGQDGDQRGIFGQRFDSAGDPTGDEFQVNAFSTGDQNDPVVAKFSDGGFVVVWEEDRGLPVLAEQLVGRRFDSAGDPVDDGFDVNDFIAGDQEDVAVAADASDQFVVAWESDGQDGHFDSIVVRRFDADALPLGDEMVVNTSTLGDQDDPSLAVHADGSFVVAWEDDFLTYPIERSFARFFDSTGSPVTDEVAVSTAADQVNPAVAVGDDGSTAVVWDSFGPDGDLVGVFGRAYDSAGNAYGGQFQVNVTTAGPQAYPAVAASGDEFLVVWVDFVNDGSGAGLFARRLGDAFFVDGFESGNTSSWSSTTTP